MSEQLTAPLRERGIFMAILVTLILGISAPIAQAQQLTLGGFGFRLESALDTLVADGESATTLIGFLNTEDGAAIDGERIRFTLQQGLATLSAPQPTGSNIAISNRAQSNGPNPRQFSVDAINVGNGVYIGRLRAGETAGTLTIAAQWLTAPTRDVPVATVNIELVTAGQLEVRVDDPVILSNGDDEATIVAYVLDDLNKPVANADLTFRIVEGSGTITPLHIDPQGNTEIPGRYAAIYRSARAPGRVIIEVALPTITNPIRAEVEIFVVEASAVEAIAFPQVVERRIISRLSQEGRLSRSSDLALQQESTATILVAARDGDGRLVSGLDARDLNAQIVSGPGGQVLGPREIRHDNGEGSGIYQFTYIASETIGDSIIEITNLQAPREASAQVVIRTVTNISAGVIGSAELAVYPEKLPFYADGVGKALIFAFAADRQGNAIVSARDPEFLLVSGRGQVETRGEQLDNLADVRGTGIYQTNFAVGSSGLPSLASIRVIFSNDDGDVVTETATIELAALGSPDVVVFPPAIPTERSSRVVLDIYDFEDTGLNLAAGSNRGQRDIRYRAEIESGPGRIIGQTRNDGRDVDLVANDKLSSVMYEIDENTGAGQDIRFAVVDELTAGFPTSFPILRIGEGTILRAFASPQIADAGSDVQIIAFAQDEFGLPAIDHELVITIVEGSASVLERGRMIDNGGTIAGFRDPYPDDGMYTGAIETTGIASGGARVRITDLTVPNLPSTELTIVLSR